MGWQWGKRVAPKQGARFFTVVLVSILLGTVALLTTIDPVEVTEYSLVLVAPGVPVPGETRMTACCLTFSLLDQASACL